MRALVVEEGWSRGALAAVRALSAAGWQVGVASPEPAGLAAASRACHAQHRIRPVQPSAGAFVESVVRALRAGSYDVVFGAGEAELLALSAARHALPAILPHAPHDAVLRAVDKVELARAARAAGIAVPDVLSADDVTDETTPTVVKARLHARPDLAGAPARIDTLLVTGRTAVRRRVAEIRDLGGEPEVQRFHPGTLVAYSAVRSACGAGVVADSLQRATRIWPPGAGASCRAETVVVEGEHAELVRRSRALLDHLGWFGLAELQFVAGPDGVHRLIDLNGRFYGSLALAVAAGANLPAVWADLARHRLPAAPVRATAGVRYQWGVADVRRAVRERHGGLLADLAGTAAYAVGARHSVASWRDPGPALARLRRPTR